MWYLGFGCSRIFFRVYFLVIFFWDSFRWKVVLFFSMMVIFFRGCSILSCFVGGGRWGERENEGFIFR